MLDNEKIMTILELNECWKKQGKCEGICSTCEHQVLAKEGSEAISYFCDNILQDIMFSRKEQINGINLDRLKKGISGNYMNITFSDCGNCPINNLCNDFESCSDATMAYLKGEIDED